VRALLIKRWHVSRRQISLFLGFFLLTMLIEIFAVSIMPTPQEIQSSLTNNERVVDAQMTLIPSIYNPQTIVVYASNESSLAKTRLLSYLRNTSADIDEITNDNVQDYVRDRYHRSADVFLNKYQLSFAAYTNQTLVSPYLQMHAYFSTVQFHTMSTSLGVAATNLFQFYANSSSKSIVTTNHPIFTKPRGASRIADVLSVLYCFEIFPIALFSLLNSIIAMIFIGILLLTLVSERLNRSKDLQLLTNLTKSIYWFSNWIFDIVLCLILIALLTAIVKVRSTASIHQVNILSALDWC
jgi:hypothetical protein